MNKKVFKNFTIHLIIPFLFFFCFAFVNFVLAQSYNDPSPQLGASLYVVPLSENPRANGNFTATLKVDSLAQPVNAVKGTLTFNKDKLEIIGVSKIGSILNLWVDEPNFSNLNGTLKFQGGVPNPGFIGNGGTVLHIIFKAKSPGITSLVWKDGEVLANDGKGTNILINLQNLDFSIDEAIGSIGATSQKPLISGGPLVYLNVALLIIFLFIAIFFLGRAILKEHDRRYHHDGHNDRNEGREVSDKIEQELQELKELEERLIKRSTPPSPPPPPLFK